jgi:hypothetical protein
MNYKKDVFERFKLSPRCGFYCPNGWEGLVEEAFDKLSKLPNWNPNNVAQVKEKFACLCIYLDNSTPAMKQIIEEADNKARKTCQYCSDPGMLRATGWWRVLCDPCYGRDLNRKKGVVDV